MIPLTVTPDGISFAVRVVPRAGCTTLAGIRDQALLIRLAAPPVDGAANAALIAYLADVLDCAARDVTLVSGRTSRRKVVRVGGMTADRLTSRLDAILGG